MSKVDAMRALREARYAATAKTAGVPRQPATAKGPVTSARAKAPGAPAAHKAASTTGEGAAELDRCGHRSMNNRSCTRDAGHSEKNHRYS